MKLGTFLKNLIPVEREYSNHISTIYGLVFYFLFSKDNFLLPACSKVKIIPFKNIYFFVFNSKRLLFNWHRFFHFAWAWKYCKLAYISII